MKRIIFIMCVFIALITSANGSELYSCIDRNGNSIITDVPQDGMTNCVLKDSYGKPSPEEPKNEKEKTFVEKDNAIVKAK